MGIKYTVFFQILVFCMISRGSFGYTRYMFSGILVYHLPPWPTLFITASGLGFSNKRLGSLSRMQTDEFLLQNKSSSEITSKVYRARAAM